MESSVIGYTELVEGFSCAACGERIINLDKAAMLDPEDCGPLTADAAREFGSEDLECVLCGKTVRLD